jgi:cytochrome c biogenesis protein CcdA
MINLLISIATIALVDSINPNAMAVQIYLLGTPKPVARAIAFIAGDFTASWVAGVLLSFGISQVIRHIFTQLGDVIYVLQFLIGAGLIYLGCNLNKFLNQPQTKRPKSLSPGSAFILGATIAFLEAPTALPYLAAIERITRENLELPKVMSVIAFYNLIFVLPLIALLIIYLIFRNNAAILLQKLHQSVTKWFPKVMKFILVTLGLVLIADCIAHIFGKSIF